MFDPSYQLAKLSPASYNPRVIDDGSRAQLRESIAALGLVKPVIATESGTLLAGHQRSQAMRDMGIQTCPAFILPVSNKEDEIRFNQLHNGSDAEFSDLSMTVPPPDSTGWKWISPKLIRGNHASARQAGQKNEILRLLSRYGSWGSAIATVSGEIIVSSLYASCSKLLNIPLLVYHVRDDQRADVLKHFGREYGRFSYEHLPVQTWAQSRAQLYRLRAGVSGERKSRTYEDYVLPQLTKNPAARVLDFGAGQMDYVKRLSSQGYNIRGVEFYFRTGAQLNISESQRLIDALCLDLQSHGRYDMVVCDSVLNSVDSPQAELDVMHCLNAFCRPGGTIVASGRSRAFVEYVSTHMTRKKAVGQCDVQFIDSSGISAMFSRGAWLYQKYHTAAEARGLGAAFIGPAVSVRDSAGTDCTAREFSASGFAIAGVKTIEIPPAQFLAGLRREFDLPLPGQRFGRSDDIEAAILAAMATEGSGNA